MDNNTQATPDFSSILNGLLSNPTAISSLMSLIGSIPKGQNAAPAPVVPQHTPPSPDTVEASTVSSVKEMPSIPASSFPSQGSLPALSYGRESREKALLLALKPFLSKNKCKTVDMFIKLLEVLSLVGGIR